MAYVYGTANSEILNADDGITSGDDFVYAGDGDDTVRGLGGADHLFGEKGTDTIYGGAGVDWIDGGQNNDTLYGGNDDDLLWGQAGDDLLYGENDNDYLSGGAGADTLDGGDGIDTASYIYSDAGVHVSLSPFVLIGSGGNSGGDAEGDILSNIEDLYGSKFDDELYGGDQVNKLNGYDGNDHLFGGDGADQLFGDDGNDVINGGAGGDVIGGGDGIDTASYEGSAQGVDVSLMTDFAAGGDAAGDHLDSIESLIGSSYTDLLSGDDGDNAINGLDGNNWLYGYGGNDVLWGGKDNDTMYGGEGTDVLKGFGGSDFLDGGDQADTMWGGTGNDTYRVDNAGDVVVEFAGEGSDTVWASIDYTLGDQVENLSLSNIGGLNGTGNDLDNVIVGNDYTNILNGGDGTDAIFGNGGDDIIDGGANADTMLGGQGFDIFIVDDFNDVVWENAGEGFDQVQTSVNYALTPGSEVEVLYADQTTTAAINLIGNELDNFVTGNDGVNVIVGGLGFDTLRGKGGGDVFLWSSAAESSPSHPDVVVDFNRAEGDLLHFTNMDADDTLPGDQNFTFKDTAAFTAPGQINWYTNGTDTFIQLNMNADVAPDSVIQVSGVHTVDASWFFL
jgi:Ca2+-binding RTX toxin-like protein